MNRQQRRAAQGENNERIGGGKDGAMKIKRWLRFESDSELIAWGTFMLTLHGLSDWRIEVLSLPGMRCAHCEYGTKTIAIDRDLVSQCRITLVQDNVLHEIAHALKPTTPPHGIEWARVAISIGCVVSGSPLARHSHILGKAQAELMAAKAAQQ